MLPKVAYSHLGVSYKFYSGSYLSHYITQDYWTILLLADSKTKSNGFHQFKMAYLPLIAIGRKQVN